MDNYSCIVIKNGTQTVFHRRGVADLYQLYHSSPEMLNGADIIDKVVGKGAATLMVAGKIKSLRTPVISEPAYCLLSAAGIPVDYKEKVAHIINRRGDGMCPLETRCIGTNDIPTLLGIIDKFVEEMKTK